MSSEQPLKKDVTDKTIVRLTIEKGESQKKEYFFKETFRVGRTDNCAVKIDDGLVSRDHLEISFKGGKWLIADLFSSNGTYLDGKKIDHLILTEPIKLELGKNGPVINLELIKDVTDTTADASDSEKSLQNYIQRYFEQEGNNQPVGDHTRMIQQAFKVVQKKQSKKYWLIIAVVAFVGILATAYAIYQHIKANEQKELAESIFYQMKGIDIQLSKLSSVIENTGNTEVEQTIEKMRGDYNRMEKIYDKYVGELDVYNLSEEDRLILKMARLFGECEINMPDNFVGEVKTFINKWKSSPRLKLAITRAQENNYIRPIIEAFLQQGLPPQFFYLALQESDFKFDIVGPITRYGYAKGMWQFIPMTARQYGLETGPLVELNQYDPLDDRFNVPKATSAAAKYIKFIYQTEAQASGLLVIGSYNWGENNF
ncbi:MAG TPA: FHA domain-containing protein, partial [Ignavibacteriaceae bacterium]|nr:FHA domain-containing protein [Ignavibacteriaceae bacterium]